MKLTAKELKDRLDGDELDLSMMSLAVVPVKELLPLKRATSLDLSCNALDGIPDAFCDLVHLVKLDLSQNRIASLPAQLGRLASLEHLDLYKNQLQELPISLAQMKRLKWLDVKENPLSPDLAKVAGDCLDAKQCGAAASRMVAHMGAVQSELERERQRRLRTEREAASAAAAIAERERMEAKAARKADKERRKAAAKANAAAKTPSNGASNGHGGAQTGKTTKGGAKKEKKSPGRGLLMGCLCGLIGLVFNCLMLCGIFVLATAGLLYLNCRNGPGGVFVRGSAKLCTEMDAWVTNGGPPKLDTVHAAAAGLRYEVSDMVAWLASRDYAALAAQAAQTTKTTAANAALWVQHKSVPAAKAFYKDSGKHATAASKFLLAKTQDAAVVAKKLSYQAYQLSLDLAQRAQRSIEGYLNQQESSPPKEAKSSKSPPPPPKESKTQRNA